MKKSILSAALLLALLIIPVLNAHSQSEEKLKAKIEKINAKLAEGMLSGDHTKGLIFYLDDAISLPSYQPMLNGIEEITKSATSANNSGMEVLSFELQTKKVEVCGDLVIEIGTYKISMTWEGMPEPVNDEGKYVTVWEKQADGSLKIKIDTWNSDINPWAEKEEEM